MVDNTIVSMPAEITTDILTREARIGRIISIGPFF